MRARGDLWHDPTERCVLLVLRSDALRHDTPLAIHKRSRGFVAGTFYAEDQNHCALPLSGIAR